MSILTSYLAIVTARSGSKRLPKKNILDLCGKPLMAWSILAAISTPKISRTIVCTDSIEYQQLAKAYGADCPWLRDPRLAMDSSSSIDVVESLLNRLAEDGSHFDALILLQPTSPLRTAADITGAINLFESCKAPAVVSICRSECSPALLGRLPRDLVMNDFLSANMNCARCEDTAPWYRINGAVYIISVDVFLSERTFVPLGTLGYEMPRSRSIDVDTSYDFQLASLLMNHLSTGGNTIN